MTQAVMDDVKTFCCRPKHLATCNSENVLEDECTMDNDDDITGVCSDDISQDDNDF